MPLSPEDLRFIAARTVGHYDQRAQSYWEATRDHDVSQNVQAFVSALRGRPPLSLLDLGCGPGRDLITFASMGHHAVGLEGSSHQAALARQHSGCDVLEQCLLALDLPDAQFDGVFANAVLFHVPSQELPRVLRQLHQTLKPGGVLFSSNPRGNGQEGWNGDRYGAFHDWPTWQRHLAAAGFIELAHFYRPPGLPIEQQPWLASLWRKPGAPRATEAPAPGTAP
jgi:SAM-dependent methyltransferase